MWWTVKRTILVVSCLIFSAGKKFLWDIDVNGFRDFADYFHIFYLQVMCRMCPVPTPMRSQMITGQTQPRLRHVALLPPEKARTAPLKLGKKEEVGLWNRRKWIPKYSKLKPFQVYDSVLLCGIDRLKFCLIVLFRHSQIITRWKWQSIIQMICAQIELPWLCLRHRWFLPLTSLM